MKKITSKNDLENYDIVGYKSKFIYEVFYFMYYNGGMYIMVRKEDSIAKILDFLPIESKVDFERNDVFLYGKIEKNTFWKRMLGFFLFNEYKYTYYDTGE